MEEKELQEVLENQDNYVEENNQHLVRKLEIKKIDKEFDDETKDKRRWALISGMFSSGVSASVLLSNISFSEAVRTEIETLNSFESLGRYLAVTTPDMWKLISISVNSFIVNAQNLSK